MKEVPAVVFIHMSDISKHSVIRIHDKSVTFICLIYIEIQAVIVFSLHQKNLRSQKCNTTISHIHLKIFYIVSFCWSMIHNDCDQDKMLN